MQRGIAFTHRYAAAPIMKNAAEIVSAFMEELEPKGPAVTVAPRRLLEGGDAVRCSRPAQDDAPTGNQLRQHSVFGIKTKVLVFPKGHAGAYMRSLIKCDRYSCGCFKNEVNVKTAEGSGEDKNKCQERSITSPGVVIRFRTRRGCRLSGACLMLR